MAESTLSVSYDDLRREIGRFLGWGRDPDNDWDEKKVLDCRDILKAGLRAFYNPPPLVKDQPAHAWSFLFPTISITTTAPYSTGTVTIVAGVVTLASGTFPAGAADGEFTLASSGVTYTVNTRDSGTQITLDDLTVTASAGSTYSLVFPYYTLPDDFASLRGPLAYRPGTNRWFRPVDLVSENQIRAARAHISITAQPQVMAIRPKKHTDMTVGQRFEACWHPVPDAAYELFGRYCVAPSELDATNKYPYGGVQHGETIVASCLHAAEQRLLEPGEWQWKTVFLERLAASIESDRAQSPDWLGYNADASDRNQFPRNPHDYDLNVVTFNGTQYS